MLQLVIKFCVTFLQVTQQFRVRLIQVDDSLPVLTMGKLMVTEGQDKPLTEFDIKVTDNDTSVC